MIEARVPGRHYEIEVFDDGRIEVELFKSDGQIGGRELIEELLADYSDKHKDRRVTFDGATEE